ncbi:tripartite tricarboxylate transporter TctB family protein [Aminivibrio sp.]|uniref:tripartite tricarboxylate transporter TctB family protein n=1 Tax=Aminivibrio sp. TaxID=1872489 RepID=UPI001A5C046A|nr:tripartite tricarboxylate transporter TctB family protein [Aminivibrio sp.]MBL3538474.1 tripartite tricarboxylate transporter TctB family protein [Aminivibrio sp.]
MKKDVALGTVMVIISSIMIWQANLLPRGNKWDMLGPAAYPKWISWALLILSVILILSSLRRNGKESWNWTALILPGFTFLILIGYVFIMPRMGFIISTLLFLVILQALLSPSQKKPWLYIACVSLFFTFALYLVSSYLNIQLPVLAL